MKITLFGTGLMGYPMAKRLLAMGHELVVYNRTYEKAASLTDFGAQVATNTFDAVTASECLILMLTNAAAIEEILLEKPELLAGKTIIQMSTIAPEESIMLHDKISGFGAEYLEAPVLGSISEAQSGTLFVLAGATPEQFSHWEEILKCFGPEPVLSGPVGHAATLKLALNQLIASLTTAFSFSLGLIQNRGVNTDIFMGILRKSALYAPTFDKKLTRMLEKDFSNPNFPTKHLAKDIDLILNEGKRIQLNTAALEGVKAIVRNSIEQGFADSDYSALFNGVINK